MTEMRITVLGSSASSPDADDACTGFLVQQGATNLLLDCGSGVLGHLRRFIDLEEITAIVISHFHPDHWLDLVPMRYGLRYGLGEIVRPKLFVPPGGAEYLAGFGKALRGSSEFFSQAFQLEEFDPESHLAIDDLNLTFQRTTHDVPTWAIAVDGAKRVVYTADTQESAEVEQFARQCDLLICESTYPASAAGYTDGTANHLTSHQAGTLAREAQAHNLMLTHFWPGYDRAVFAEEAGAAFGKPVLLARSGVTIVLDPLLETSIGESVTVIDSFAPEALEV